MFDMYEHLKNDSNMCRILESPDFWGDSEPFMWENTSQWYQQCTDASSSSSNLVINASFLQNVTANNSLADNNSSGSELTTFKTNNNSPSPSDFDTNSEQCFHTNKESNYTEQKRESKIKKVKPPKKKLGKIWEFIKTLLLEECTDLVQWTDYKNGEFRLVQNRKVAQLWGERSNNPTMNYEKFSRALRYHYKRNYLCSVRGKRLVYKFGSSAKFPADAQL